MTIYDNIFMMIYLFISLLIKHYLAGGLTILKNKNVSWDHDIPNWMESHKIPWFQTHQPAIKYYLYYDNIWQYLYDDISI